MFNINLYPEVRIASYLKYIKFVIVDVFPYGT